MKNLLLFLLIFSISMVQGQTFKECADSLGISHTLSSTVHWGAGVSFFDFDNDGWDDITLVQQGDSAYFYKNMGGYFDLQPSLIFAPYRAVQLIWVDYDNDGDNDLFLTAFDGACKLLQNDGNMQFTDVTADAGLFGLNSDNYGASFADYDKDGDLDLYLCRYYGQGDPANPMQTNRLFRNNGNGTFTDVTDIAGVANGIAPSFIGIWFDYNGDTWPDLLVINDRSLWINTFYRNNGDGTFTDVTAATNTAMFYNGLADDPMSGTFADFDNDGDMDVYSSNTGGIESPGRLLVAQNDLVFTEEAVQRGVDIGFWSWGSTFIDTDNDTWQDLYVTTGTIAPHIWQEVRSYLYMSNNGLNFTDSPQNFSNSSHIAASYSVAKGDVNNDGYADMIVTNAKGFLSYFWLNNATAENNYVKITLEGTLSNKMAIGSWIRVYVDTNVYYYYTRCGENYVSQNSQHHIFGLGLHENIDSIEVTYLSGITDRYYDLEVNEHYYFTEGETLVFAIEDVVSAYICFGDSIELSAPQFDSYLWNTGDTTQTLSVYTQGTYYLSAWNEFGHPYTSDTIELFTLIPIYIEQTVTDELCYSDYSGSIYLNVFNDGQDYDITWSNGAFGLSMDSLTAGNYSYTYLDEYGCSVEENFDIQGATTIVLFTETTPQVDNNLGSLSVAVLGGEPPYQIFIDDMNMIGNPMILDSGTYLVSVTDAFGCIHEEYVTILFQSTNSLHEISMDNYHIYPNPNSTKMAHCVGFTPDDVVQISDARGRIISFEKQGNSIEVDANFTGLAHILISINRENKMISVVFI